jgi:hypothetical protein
MGLLEILIILLIIMWITGTGFAIGGSAIHLLLVIVIVLVIFRLVRNRGGDPLV